MRHNNGEMSSFIIMATTDLANSAVLIRQTAKLLKSLHNPRCDNSGNERDGDMSLPPRNQLPDSQQFCSQEIRLLTASWLRLLTDRLNNGLHDEVLNAGVGGDIEMIQAADRNR